MVAYYVHTDTRLLCFMYYLHSSFHNFYYALLTSTYLTFSSLCIAIGITNVRAGKLTRFKAVVDYQDPRKGGEHGPKKFRPLFVGTDYQDPGSNLKHDPRKGGGHGR
ncbi:hypothetical protein CTI12_AA047260 [Artemisia annua]|uniref:Uncharacterized protein n=1 Tax=Artemisia annua TaxID=35608 RepID=A0A2U1QCM2_ARTAN|nr:hypothetical protein CTI12_AA047260 [Artemisia annua]